MRLEEAIARHLRAHAGLTALIAGRVYPVRLPPYATLPAVTYQRVGGRRYLAMGAPSGMAEARMQFDAWSGPDRTEREPFAQVQSVAEQLRLALHGLSGHVQGLEIGAVTVLNELSLYEEGFYRVSMDAQVWYREAIA